MKTTKLLENLYEESVAKRMEEEIKKVCSKYMAQLGDRRINPLSEKDVLLIVYGDQVYNNDKKSKLDSLHCSLKKYLADAVNHIHILPFYPYSSDDGFSVIDFYEVNEDMGDWDDIQSLSSDFTLMFDAVINHMSSTSAWFQGYLDDDPAFKNYFIDGSAFNKLENVVRPRVSPLIHSFRNNKKVWTTFSEDQVDLNYENPDLLLQIIDLLLFYLSKGAGLLRLDAVGFLWKENDTTCIHLDETHTVIKLLREVLSSCVEGVKLITETNVPHKENISYFGCGDEAHMVYNFTLPPLLAFSILNGETEKLVQWAQSLTLPTDDVCFFNFLASHDGIGVRPVGDILTDHELDSLLDEAVRKGGRVSYKAGPNGNSPYEINCNYFDLIGGSNKEVAKKRMLLAHAVLLAFPGLPAIYFHSFFGLHNDIEGMNAKGYNRAINRQKLSMDELDELVSDEQGDSHFILSNLKKMITKRKKYPAFDPYAQFEFPNLDNGLFAITRKPTRENEKTVTAYFNLSQNPKCITLSKDMVDILSDEKVPCGELKLAGLEFRYLV